MRSSSSAFAGFVLVVGFLAISAFFTVGVSASAPAPETAPISAAKTYKRKCTSSKCGVISEKTQPIFKCPICGSNTVPVN